MAVTARFIADFTSFNSAVQKAEVELKSFETGASKVSASLTRMTDQFSGRKLIQEATLMTAAIERVGGVSALTEKELRKVAATVAEATTKMRALGIDVPASFDKISAAAKKLESSVGTAGGGGLAGAFGKLNGLLGGFGAALTVGAAVSFGRSILDDADALVKMSDKTGIGTQGLQKFQIAGDDAGNTVEQMTSAINKMQDKLVGGDKSFIGAIKTLNIDLAAFSALKPEDQFIAISDALRGVVDPAEQVNLAIDLFGKTGAEVLPVLKRGFDDVKNAAVGMSDETVRALDTAGDKLNSWWRSFKATAAEAIVFVAELPNKIGFGINEEELFGAKARKQSPGTADRNTEIKNLGLAAKNAEPDVKKLGEALKVVTLADFKGIRNLKDDFTALGQTLKTNPILPNVDDFIRTGVAITDLKQDFSGLGAAIQPALINARAFTLLFRPGDVGIFSTVAKDAKEVNSTLGSMSDLFVRLGQASGGTMGQMLGDIGQLVVVLDAQKKASKEGATAADKWAVAIAAAAAAVQTFNAQTAKAGAISGATAGAAFGPYGALIGGLAGLVIGHHNAQKAAKEQAQEVEKLRLSYAQTLGRGGVGGTLDDLRAKAKSVGLEIQTMLTTKNAETFRYEMERLQKALQFQDDALQQLDDTLKKYNISIGDAGAAAATRLLGEEAKGLYTDFKVLEAGGVDAATSITGMQDALSQLVRDSIKSGVALPKQFESIIAQMRALGLLTDDVGDKFTDAELDALSFGGTLTDEIDDLTSAIRELTDAIGRGLGTAIRNLPAFPGAGGSPKPDEPRLPESTMAALRGGGGSGVSQSVNGAGRERSGPDLELAMAALARTVATLPMDMARAMRDAVLATGGRLS